MSSRGHSGWPLGEVIIPVRRYRDSYSYRMSSGMARRNIPTVEDAPVSARFTVVPRKHRWHVEGDGKPLMIFDNEAAALQYRRTLQRQADRAVFPKGPADPHYVDVDVFRR